MRIRIRARIRIKIRIRIGPRATEPATSHRSGHGPPSQPPATDRATGPPIGDKFAGKSSRIGAAPHHCNGLEPQVGGATVGEILVEIRDTKHNNGFRINLQAAEAGTPTLNLFYENVAVNTEQRPGQMRGCPHPRTRTRGPSILRSLLPLLLPSFKQGEGLCYLLFVIFTSACFLGGVIQCAL